MRHILVQLGFSSSESLVCQDCVKTSTTLRLNVKTACLVGYCWSWQSNCRSSRNRSAVKLKRLSVFRFLGALSTNANNSSFNLHVHHVPCCHGSISDLAAFQRKASTPASSRCRREKCSARRSKAASWWDVNIPGKPAIKVEPASMAFLSWCHWSTQTWSKVLHTTETIQ